MMILQVLTDQFQQRFQHEKRAQVCLWFDEKQEFRRLIPGFKQYLEETDCAPFHLLDYDPVEGRGQIWIKHRIYRERSGLSAENRKKKRFVIYVPFPEDRLKGPDEEGSHHLELLMEYAVAGLIWRIGGKQPTLFALLRQAGIPLPANPSDQRSLWEGGTDSLLAKYTARFMDRPHAFWQSILTPELVRSRLVGDMDQTLLDLAAAPDAAWSQIRKNGLAKEFLDTVKERYGFELPLEDPEAWIREFVSILALTETFLGYGEPEDFPFLNRLPPIAVRENHIQLLGRWLRDAEARPVWDRLILEVESEVDLADWAAHRNGLSFGFPHLVSMRWRQALAAFEKAANRASETKTFFTQYGKSIRKEAEYAKAGRTEVGAWALLEDMGHLASSADRAMDRIGSVETVSGLTALFCEFCPQLDGKHLKIRHVAMEKELPIAGMVADRVYGDYLNALNRRFFEFFAAQETAEISGAPSVTLYLEKEIWEAKGKLAVILVDGLRFDCAHEIKGALSGVDVKIKPLCAGLPPITSIGMTALMPISGCEMGFVQHGNTLHPTVNGKDMGVRQNRIAFMKGFGADCREIAELENASEAPVDLGELLLVFGHEELDHIGHESAEALIRHLYIEIERLARMVRKIHRWGYPEVHIVTDHGFILIDEKQLPPEVACDKAWCHVLKERFALVPAEADLPLKTFPFVWDQSMRVAFSPGLAFFKAEKSFSHGGATLQELIIPHLVSRIEATKKKRVDVEVVLPTFTLMQSFVKVTLRARTDQMDVSPQMDLFGEIGRTLSIDVFKVNERGKRKSVLATEVPKTVKIDTAENQTTNLTVFFHSSLSLNRGDLLELEIQDAETGEQFPPGGIKLTIGRHIESGMSFNSSIKPT